MTDAAPSMTDLLARLDRWLREHRPDCYQRLQPGVSAAELDDFERLLGFPLCPAFRELYQWRNGELERTWGTVTDPAQEMPQGVFWIQWTLDSWDFHSLESVRSSWECFTGLLDGGNFDAPHHWDRHWVPFLGDGGGNEICVDHRGLWTGDVGQILYFDHEGGNRTIYAPSLERWLQIYVESLEAGDWGVGTRPMSRNITPRFQFLSGSQPRLPGYPKSFEPVEEHVPQPTVPAQTPDPMYQFAYEASKGLGFRAAVIEEKADPVQVGDRITIREGAFVDMEGVVTRYDRETDAATVDLFILGRSIPIDFPNYSGRYGRRLSLILDHFPDLWTARKARLFACACFRRVLDLFPKDLGANLIHLTELFADCQATRQELHQGWLEISKDAPVQQEGTINFAWIANLMCDVSGTEVKRLMRWTVVPFLDIRPSEDRHFVALLCHIFGDQTRLTPEGGPYPSTVVQLAEAVYRQEQKAVGPLRDALLDAGLTELGEHFTDATAWHPKGCWAVDWLTARS